MLQSPPGRLVFAVLIGCFNPSRLYLRGTLETMTNWKDSLDSKQSNETPGQELCTVFVLVYRVSRQKESSSLTLWETPMGLHLVQPSSLTSLKLQRWAIRLAFNIKTNITRKTKSTKSSQSDSHITHSATSLCIQ